MNQQATPRQRRVSVLGAGIMGAAMVQRLLDEGFDVDVWDRTSGRAASMRRPPTR
jgi:3-hydroxyisobutyrate dehydrogenase-like beta-hydroxyacid dehydrogenase